MESSSNVSSFFVALLTVLFIGLKLTDYIDWSWVWVLSPLWIELAILIVGFAGALAFFAIRDAFNK